MSLRARLQSGKILVAPGAYDALSARLLEQAGFEAVYRGGYAASAAAFALPDLGITTLTDMVDHLRRMTNAIGVPVIATFWANETQRDTDFYRFVVTEPTAVIARAWGSVTMQLAIVDHCTVLGSGAGTCTDASACLAPGVYNVFVAPLDAYPTCGALESTYTVLLSLDSAAAPCTPLLGDIDRDGAINGIDLFHVLNRWGSVDPGSCDLNGDERADGLDLGIMLSNWTG